MRIDRRKDDKAFIEVGYIYLLVISALVFVSLTTMITSKVTEEKERSVHFLLREIGVEIASKVNEAITVVNVHPYIFLDVTIDIPTMVQGEQYTMLVKGTEMYLNSSATGTTVKIHLLLSAKHVHTCDLTTGADQALISSYGSINLKYGNQLTNNAIQLTESRG